MAAEPFLNEISVLDRAQFFSSAPQSHPVGINIFPPLAQIVINPRTVFSVFVRQSDRSIRPFRVGGLSDGASDRCRTTRRSIFGTSQVRLRGGVRPRRGRGRWQQGHLPQVGRTASETGGGGAQHSVVPGPRQGTDAGGAGRHVRESRRGRGSGHQTGRRRR
jgi:hypothetical protein